jgi:uncharacterized membrane protein YfcA
VLTHVTVLVIPHLAAVAFGAWLFKVLPANAFRIIVLWFLILISLAILLA